MTAPLPADFVSAMLNQAHGFWHRDPEFLRETWGAPSPARIYLARLIGFDDETVAEIELPDRRAHWLMPVARRLTAGDYEHADPYDDPPATATYRCTNAMFVVRFDLMSLMSFGIEPRPGWNYAEPIAVSCSRFKRVPLT